MKRTKGRINGRGEGEKKRKEKTYHEHIARYAEAVHMCTKRGRKQKQKDVVRKAMRDGVEVLRRALESMFTSPRTGCMIYCWRTKSRCRADCEYS